MSIWGDIRKKSLGQEYRKENNPWLLIGKWTVEVKRLVDINQDTGEINLKKPKLIKVQ